MEIHKIFKKSEQSIAAHAQSFMEKATGLVED